MEPARATQLPGRGAPRVLAAPGLLVAAAGMALLTQLSVGSDYLNPVLPAEVLLGLGTACAMVPAFSNATLGMEPRLAGVAAATVSAGQQVGASIGTALLNTIAAATTAGYLPSHAAGHAAAATGLVDGYSTATAWGAGILPVGALLAATLINAGSPEAQRDEMSTSAAPGSRDGGDGMSGTEIRDRLAGPASLRGRQPPHPSFVLCGRPARWLADHLNETAGFSETPEARTQASSSRPLQAAGTFFGGEASAMCHLTKEATSGRSGPTTRHWHKVKGKRYRLRRCSTTSGPLLSRTRTASGGEAGRSLSAALGASLASSPLRCRPPRRAVR